ncbi:ferritin-like domain-containing protein [Synechococcus sp. PCC 7336]|uniref:ferritin-like domain-containing protein n=1 Tax=Synechococcus sp. PCC 7336 TaxID=195250 RepID=UPI0012EA92B2|nr:ferritin-like domain-containing protein [Synechococcus sp. PCC 7336]
MLATLREELPRQEHSPGYNYFFRDKKLEKILHESLHDSCNIFDDFAWDTSFDASKIGSDCTHSSITGLPEFKKLTKHQQSELKAKELIYHVSNLLAGEHKAVSLAAKIMTECPQDSLDIVYCGTAILSDERNHFMALLRYLQDKVGFHYKPHPKLQATFDTLLAEESYEIKLFVSQIALEWTASSLLSSLLMKNPEPLLKQILVRIIKDESRHLAFNRWVFNHMQSEQLSRLKRSLEDLFFESLVAITASFFAIPVWKEYELSKSECINYTARDLEQRGVLRFYSQVLPRQLSRCNIYSDRLMSLIENNLLKKVIEAHYSYEPSVFVGNVR